MAKQKVKAVKGLDNMYYDVEKIRKRLHELGYNRIKIKENGHWWGLEFGNHYELLGYDPLNVLDNLIPNEIANFIVDWF